MTTLGTTNPVDWARILSGVGQGLMQAGTPGGNFGQGLMQGVQFHDQGVDRKRQAELEQMRIDMLRQEQEAQRLANTKAAEEEQAIQNLINGGGGIQTASAPNGLSQAQFGGAPAAPGGQPFFDPQTAEQIKRLPPSLQRAAVEAHLGNMFAAPKEKTTDDLTEYAMYQGQGGTEDFTTWMRNNRKAGASSTTVMNTIGGDNAADSKLRSKLSEKEGERWSGLKEAGVVSASLGQDFQVLDQLLTVAPQGPIEGNLAATFPGFSSAGDAFQSVVTRVAPSLRTPGSGATSDIEYEGMLKSLPRLGNTPEGNRIIAETMKAKAALNVERSEIVTAYENEEITAKEARRRLAEVDKRSILSPELRSALGIVGVDMGGSRVVDELPPGFE